MALRDAYERTLAFMDACAELNSPVAPRFKFVNGPQMPAGLPWERDFADQFGPRLPIVPIAPGQIDSAIDFLRQIDPQPLNPWGMAPLWLQISWRVRLKDPGTGRTFEHQDPALFGRTDYGPNCSLGESALRLFLNNRASLGVELCLPGVDDDELRRLLPKFQAKAPFKFSTKQWRRWSPTRAGGFRSRKITL
jgi:hypothetical protein